MKRRLDLELSGQWVVHSSQRSGQCRDGFSGWAGDPKKPSVQSLSQSRHLRRYDQAQVDVPPADTNFGELAAQAFAITSVGGLGALGLSCPWAFESTRSSQSFSGPNGYSFGNSLMRILRKLTVP